MLLTILAATFILVAYVVIAYVMVNSTSDEHKPTVTP